MQLARAVLLQLAGRDKGEMMKVLKKTRQCTEAHVSRKEKGVFGALAKTKTEEFKYILMHPFKHEWPTWNDHISA